MKIYERLAHIIKQKGLSRKEFAQKLINLSPNVSRIGETPTVSTIYAYLNGRISMPIELIPYIAEVLDISEQELFDVSPKARKKHFKLLISKCSNEELNHFAKILNNKILLDSKDANEVLFSQEKAYNEKLKEISLCLRYAPLEFIDKFIKSLKKFKNLSDSF